MAGGLNNSTQMFRSSKLREWIVGCCTAKEVKGVKAG